MTVSGAGRLRWYDWLLAVSGVGLLVVMFLHWFTASGEVGELSVDDDVLRFTTDDGRRSAWQAFASIDIVLAATIVAALALTVLAIREARGDRACMLAGTVVVLALISTVLVGIRLLVPPSLALAPNVAVSSTPWAWIGLLACCLLLVGGIVSLRALREHESATSAPDPGRGHSAHSSS
ncbi:MAG TPA: hypothetical protein VKB25_15990 [Conexibacter sp.]|nr:hypothetical protein [Conexibacter sp.]